MRDSKNRIPLDPRWAKNANPNLVNQILDFVRVDGKLDGKFCFLSMEDGGSIESVQGDLQKHILELKKYISQSSWVPDEDTILKMTGKENQGEALVGIPGGRIAKIMFNILGTAQDSGEYLQKKLYRSNECNIKFYPLGKPRANVWYSNWEKIGLSDFHYRDWCIHNRCEVIFNKHGKDILNSKVIVMIGARDEWLRCLAPILDIDFKCTEYYWGENYEYHFYFSSNKELKLSYINCLQRNLTDDAIFNFSQKLIHLSDYLKKNTPRVHFRQGQNGYSIYFPSFENFICYLNKSEYRQFWLTTESIVSGSIFPKKKVTTEDISIADFEWLCEENKKSENRYLGI